MKKLAIVVLLVVAACHRQNAVSGVTGAPTARAAVEMFLAAGKAQDLEALGRIWGTSSGPAAATLDRTVREQREVIMMPCLKHDTFQVVAEVTSAGVNRVLSVELSYKDLTASSNFIATQGPGSRWYVQQFEPKDLQMICVAR